MSIGVRRTLEQGILLARKFITVIEGWDFDRTEICGSIRRELSEIGDIDIVVVVGDETQRELLNSRLMSLWGPLKTKKYRAKRSGPFEDISVNVIDILPHQAGAALLHSTGSAEFNVVLRRHARDSKGWKLNQYGLFEAGTNIPVCDCFSEEAVFSQLGLRYLSPRDRGLEYDVFRNKNKIKV